MAELQDVEIARIKKNLKPDERITSIMAQTVGRPDLGHQYVNKMKEANVPMSDGVYVLVYNTGIFSNAVSNWGEMTVMYTVEKF